jgi:hypothetical protein
MGFNFDLCTVTMEIRLKPLEQVDVYSMTPQNIILILSQVFSESNKGLIKPLNSILFWIPK